MRFAKFYKFIRKLRNFFSSDEFDIEEKEQAIEGNLVDFLYNSERVLCFVLSYDEEINETAKYIINTWGKRCNKLILFSDKLSEFSPIKLNQVH